MVKTWSGWFWGSWREIAQSSVTKWLWGVSLWTTGKRSGVCLIVGDKVVICAFYLFIKRGNLFLGWAIIVDFEIGYIKEFIYKCRNLILRISSSQ